jgi:hypothetical protein
MANIPVDALATILSVLAGLGFFPVLIIVDKVGSRR